MIAIPCTVIIIIRFLKIKQITIKIHHSLIYNNKKPIPWDM